MKRRTLPIVGGVGTLIYLGGAAAFCFAHSQAFSTLAADGWANFLAGVFAPLAFLWLVLGYFQQGEELHNSAEALRLQGEELRASVEQQRELVAVSREQFEHDRARSVEEREELARRARPLLRIDAGGSWPVEEGKSRGHRTFLINSGARGTEFSIFLNGDVITRFPLLDTGARHEFHLIVPLIDEPRRWEIDVRYLDSLLLPGEQKFVIDIPARNGIAPLVVLPAPIAGNMDATLDDVVAENRDKPAES